MKVTSVKLLDKGCVVEGISCGKEISVQGNSVEEASKKIMKLDNYFTRDNEVLADIKLVLEEQEKGIRNNPNSVLEELPVLV